MYVYVYQESYTNRLVWCFEDGRTGADPTLGQPFEQCVDELITRLTDLGATEIEISLIGKKGTINININEEVVH